MMTMISRFRLWRNPEPTFSINLEEARYLVQSIQHEYLNKETYYFASALFNRMEKFVAENDELARRTGKHSQ